MIRAHVVPVWRGWTVRVLGETLTEAPDSATAELFAADYLRDHGGGELVLHYTDHRAPRIIRIEVDRGDAGDGDVTGGA